MRGKTSVGDIVMCTDLFIRGEIGRCAAITGRSWRRMHVIILADGTVVRSHGVRRLRDREIKALRKNGVLFHDVSGTTGVA
jgi:mRNA degradation ribonuclease J1/J2